MQMNVIVEVYICLYVYMSLCACGCRMHDGGVVNSSSGDLPFRDFFLLALDGVASSLGHPSRMSREQPASNCEYISRGA
jgi:hypothetical protein